MFELYSEKDSYEDICSDVYPHWKEIVSNQIDVYLNMSDDELDEELSKPESLILLFLNSYPGAKTPKASLNNFDRYYNDLSSLLENPRSGFILNIDRKEAEKIKKEYGIAVFSNNELEENVHYFKIDEAFSTGEIVESEDGSLKGWGKFATDFQKELSNSLIINDRNLFSNEFSCFENGVRVTKNLGCENILKLLDAILPKSLQTSFHLLIISQINNDQTRRNRINNVIKDLHEKIKQLRNFGIEVEILLVHGRTKYFEETHNRIVLVNYHIATALHGLDFFKHIRNCIAQRTDRFTLEGPFYSDSCLRKAPYKLALSSYLGFKNIIQDAENKLSNNGQNENEYLFIRNGVPTINIINRLLN